MPNIKELKAMINQLRASMPKQFIAHFRKVGWGEGIDTEYSPPLPPDYKEGESLTEEHILISIRPVKVAGRLDSLEDED